MRHKRLRYTLIGDGSSDKALLHIIKWLLDDLYPELATKEQFADFSGMLTPPTKGDIVGQVREAKNLYPFDVLFYHRDSESKDVKTIKKRKDEVLTKDLDGFNIVCVVPVTMMETWLLISEEAIKKAAGNRAYKDNLALPPVVKLESQNNPKEMLHRMLTEASGGKNRKFNVHKAVHLVAEHIDDYSKLRGLKAFNEFEKDLKEAIAKALGT